jgi:Fe-S cluster assembly iron-binding protein IscA
MTLYESTDGLKECESGGVKAYIDSGLYDQLEKIGDISVDYVTNQIGQSGFKITIGNGDCKSGGCSGC